MSRYDADPYYVSPRYEEGVNDASAAAADTYVPLIERLAVALDNLTAAAMGLVPEAEIEAAMAALKSVEGEY